MRCVDCAEFWEDQFTGVTRLREMASIRATTLPVHMERWPDEDRRSRIVFITRGLKSDRLQRSLSAFMASSSDDFTVPLH